MSVDPLNASGSARNPQSWNRYSYCYNNPLLFIDPSGMLPGEFFDKNGENIGTDGVADGKVYVVFDKNDVKAAQQAKKTGQKVNGSSLGSAVEFPEAASRDEMGIDAVKRSNSPTADDKQGGFHEDGTLVGLDANGKQVAVPARSGPYKDPKTQGGASINTAIAADPSRQNEIVTRQFSSHVHPMGFSGGGMGGGGATFGTNGYFDQGPSTEDYAGAKAPINFVIGARDKMVTVYRQNSNNKPIGTMKLSVFLSVGRPK